MTKGINNRRTLAAAALLVTLSAMMILSACVNPTRGQSVDQFISAQPAVSNSVIVIKATKGPFLWYNCYNPNLADAYIQFFDLASTPTVGTTAPTRSYLVAGLSATGLTGPAVGAQGSLYAANAIKVAATTTSTGAVAPSSSLQCDFAFR